MRRWLKKLFDNLLSNSVSIKICLCLSFSILMVSALLVQTLISNNLYRESFTQQSMNYNLNYSSQLSKTFSEMFSQMDLEIRSLCKGDIIQNMVMEDSFDEDNNSVLGEVYKNIIYSDNASFNSLESISLYTKNGFVYQSNSFLYKLNNIFATTYYEKALENPASIQWIGYNRDIEKYEAVKLVYDKEYIVRGILTLYFDSDFIKNILSGSDISGDLYIYDKTGRTIYKENNNNGLAGNIYDLLPEMKEPAGYFYNGKQLILYRNLAAENNTTSTLPDWCIIFLNTDKEINQISDNVSKIILMWCLLFSLIAFIVILYISHRITKPIHSLIRFMNVVIETENFKLKSPERYSLFRELNLFAKTFNFMIAKISQLIDNIVKERLKKKRIEEKLLTSQITPHFLYNALQLLSLQAYESGNTEMYGMISNLSYILTENIRTTEKTVTVSKELKYISAYMKIIDYRYEGKVSYNVSSDPELDAFVIPKFMLQTFVENSIHHGLVPKKGMGMIELNIRRSLNQVVFEIADDGVGIMAEKLRNIKEAYLKADFELEDVQSHIGIKNVYYRLRMAYGGGFEFDIQSVYLSGTKITIKLPYSENSQSINSLIQEND